jgi:hypothetical protein
VWLKRKRPDSEANVDTWSGKQPGHSSCSDVLKMLDDTALGEFAEAGEQAYAFVSKLFSLVIVSGGKEHWQLSSTLCGL